MHVIEMMALHWVTKRVMFSALPIDAQYHRQHTSIALVYEECANAGVIGVCMGRQIVAMSVSFVGEWVKSSFRNAGWKDLRRKIKTVLPDHIPLR